MSEDYETDDGGKSSIEVSRNTKGDYSYKVKIYYCDVKDKSDPETEVLSRIKETMEKLVSTYK